MYSEALFVTRILYEAGSSSGWGEHELDYILMLRQGELSLNPSPEEVRDTEWVGRDHLQVSDASGINGTCLAAYAVV